MRGKIFFVLIFFFSLTACVHKETFFISKDKAFELGVASFKGDFSSKFLNSLDQILNQELIKRGWEGYKDFTVVRQCEEIILSKGARLRGIEKWCEIGKCVPVRYLLVPELKRWRERKGSKWGVVEPSMVEFFFYLIDVKKKEVIRVFHFNKEQKALSENILEIKKFFKRKGWITAKELFTEGVIKGLKELGL